jgi:hypothetical protein
MGGLVISQSPIFVAQAWITQAKTAAHGGGATPRFPDLSASFTVAYRPQRLWKLNN